MCNTVLVTPLYGVNDFATKTENGENTNKYNSCQVEINKYK